MAAKTTELLLNDLPQEVSRRLTRQFDPDEQPVIICYNSSRYFYIIITNRRIISVYVRTKYSDLVVTSILLTDIVQIDEWSTGNFMGYKIFTVNQQDYFQVSLDGAGELALKFGDMLYQMFNQAKLVR